jgi:hypothetical protein
VEVYLLDADAVHPCLGFPEPSEYPARGLLDIALEGAAVDNIQDLGEVPFIRCIGDDDVELCAGDAMLSYLINIEPDVQPEPVEPRCQRLHGDAHIDHGAEEHVPADARKTV